jgi:hypothetical protein
MPNHARRTRAKHCAKPWDGGSDCDLCDPDHSDRDARAILQLAEYETMAKIHTYEGLWDLSLIDDRNERPLLSGFVAIMAVWAIAVLFALV